MNPRRKGVSLIEVLVTVTISSVVLVAGISLIHTMLGMDRTTRSSVNVGITASRLSRVFRQDVHQATEFRARVRRIVPRTRSSCSCPASKPSPTKSTATGWPALPGKATRPRTRTSLFSQPAAVLPCR